MFGLGLLPGAPKRELIAPHGDMRYVRRDEKGRIKESDDVSRSLPRLFVFGDLVGVSLLSPCAFRMRLERCNLTVPGPFISRAALRAQRAIRSPSATFLKGRHKP